MTEKPICIKCGGNLRQLKKDLWYCDICKRKVTKVIHHWVKEYRIAEKHLPWVEEMIKPEVKQ